MDSITNYKNRALSALENKWGNFVAITFKGHKTKCNKMEDDRK